MKQTLLLLKTLADKTRLELYLLLQQEELCVCELEFILGIEQSRISHNLKTLVKADLIKKHREGKYIIYSIDKNQQSKPVITSIIKTTQLPAATKQKLKLCKASNIRPSNIGAKK